MKIFTMETIKNEDKAAERLAQVFSDRDNFQKTMEKIIDNVEQQLKTVYSDDSLGITLGVVLNALFDADLDFSEEDQKIANELISNSALELIKGLINEYMTPKCKEYLAEKFKKECLD